ncbi:hypothetical protein PI125_g24501 [Phytophthora idaei]|nr:hypothetical protein PI125_g24501 [Phytophthora idaei]KAG3125880.1 hypothetical protein PI126_g22571 [Phytophthora idaei]
MNTIVDDAMTRGVSGGERKRVTTGEMEFGTKCVTLMDEISMGLDSAATYDIINTQRSVAHTLRKTVVVALLQPSPEVFALFDDVMILNEGQLMYHGPCNNVEEYFESLGFKCPPQRDIADYLLDLGTREQYQYQVERPTKQPRRASEFADAFRESRLYQGVTVRAGGPVRPRAAAKCRAEHEADAPVQPVIHGQHYDSATTSTHHHVPQQALHLRSCAHDRGHGSAVLHGLLRLRPDRGVGRVGCCLLLRHVPVHGPVVPDRDLHGRA